MEIILIGLTTQICELKFIRKICNYSNSNDSIEIQLIV